MSRRQAVDKPVAPCQGSRSEQETRLRSGRVLLRSGGRRGAVTAEKRDKGSGMSLMVDLLASVYGMASKALTAERNAAPCSLNSRILASVSQLKLEKHRRRRMWVAGVNYRKRSDRGELGTRKSIEMLLMFNCRGRRRERRGGVGGRK